MTTHETRPETGTDARRDSGGARPRSGAPAETAEAPAHPRPPPRREWPPEAADTPIEPTHLATANPSKPTLDKGSTNRSDQMLFADAELSGLRSRWTEVQSAFVDDPRDCVQKADGLVADVVES